MEPFANRRQDAKSDHRPERPWVASEIGIILLDASLQLIAFNREAATILTYPHAPPQGHQHLFEVLKEVLAGIAKPAKSRASMPTYFRAGKRQYVCRSFLLETTNDNSGTPTFALLIQRNSSLDMMIHRIASKFGLTERESEALIGISMGLTSKEMAERMSISPNTVKTYLRLIMMKMGVSNRGKIFAKMLEDNQIWDPDFWEKEHVAASATTEQ